MNNIKKIIKNYHNISSFHYNSFHILHRSTPIVFLQRSFKSFSMKSKNNISSKKVNKILPTQEEEIKTKKASQKTNNKSEEETVSTEPKPTNKQKKPPKVKSAKENIEINKSLREAIYSLDDKPNRFSLYLGGQAVFGFIIFGNDLLSYVWIFQVFWVEKT